MKQVVISALVCLSASLALPATASDYDRGRGGEIHTQRERPSDRGEHADRGESRRETRGQERQQDSRAASYGGLPGAQRESGNRGDSDRISGRSTAPIARHNDRRHDPAPLYDRQRGGPDRDQFGHDGRYARHDDGGGRPSSSGRNDRYGQGGDRYPDLRNQYGRDRNQRWDDHDGRSGGDRHYGGRDDYRRDGRHDYSHDWRRPEWRHSWRHGWSGQRYHAPARYYYPRGYSYRSWQVGWRLPLVFLSSSYFIDYRPYGLAPPPYGCHWVRVDGDLLLVELASGEIVDTLYRFFY